MEENLELRKEILKYALHLEDTVTLLIKSYFFVGKEKLKALSHKSGSLSFKNKIDLLSDFEIISDDENTSLLRLMEFRNQFMHNLNCASFTTAVAILGIDKGNHLLKYLETKDSGLSLEQKYVVGFQNCFLNSQKKLIEKLENKISDVEFKANVLQDLTKDSIYLIDKYNDLLVSITTRIAAILVENKVDAQILLEIIDTIGDNLTNMSFTRVDKIELTLDQAKRMLK